MGDILRNHLDDVGGGIVELERRRQAASERRWRGKVAVGRDLRAPGNSLFFSFLFFEHQPLGRRRRMTGVGLMHERPRSIRKIGPIWHSQLLVSSYWPPGSFGRSDEITSQPV